MFIIDQYLMIRNQEEWLKVPLHSPDTEGGLWQMGIVKKFLQLLDMH